MKPCVLYFSRTGNTKRMAEAIAQATDAPIFDIATSASSVTDDFDMLIIGMPVEGFRPAKEPFAWVESLPKAEDKKAILFCTYALYKGSIFKKLEKALSSNGYRTVLKVPKKGIKPDRPADFSDAIAEVKKTLE
ncbi:MAG: hypothetical protein NWF05_11540 [Candidatus Bathyarchaeota archaeon]|nr:hypothetical protein [Candidatus Bathyarchaeota archaeon]